MQNQRSLRRVILTNLLWFLGSLVLGFIVWLIATEQSDPFEQWRLSGVPIHVAPDAGLIITNQTDLPNTVTIQLQAPRSVHQLLAPDDVIITADLSGVTPGEHTVKLQANVARQASVVAISPSQITVKLEVQQSELKPVRVEITSQPALVYTVGEPVVDVHQVTVSGTPESKVEQVVEAIAQVSLEGLRTSYDENVRVTPVDADGNAVSGVTVDPQSVHVQIDIEPRSDVREVRVQPNIVGELPEGYVLTPEFDYDPKTIVVSGPAAVLESLPGTFFTAPISLSDKTSSFIVTVPVELPDPRLVVVTGRTVTVTVGIATQTITRQFDHIPVEFIGAKTGLDYSTVNNEVTVLVTGPQPLLNQLTEDDLTVLVDVSSLNAGESAQLAPTATIQDSGASVTTSVLPAQIDVTATAQTTEEPGGD